jgi:uncharacterized LabA/DUF88 family protein
MILPRNNYAFIDSQNFHLGIKKLGWQLDYRKFRIYLREKYGVERAYLFIGFIESNQRLYDNLVRWDFDIVFKPTVITWDGKIKGNIDADLVLKAMAELNNYDKAVIVSSDGDFYSLVNYLDERGKLEAVLTSEVESCSRLLQEAAKKNIRFINEMQQKLEYKKEPPKDGTLSGAFNDDNDSSIAKRQPPSNSI